MAWSPWGLELHGGPTTLADLVRALVQQPHVVHGVQQLPVGGLEAVDLRDGPGDDDRHGVGHIVDFQRLCDGLLQHLGVGRPITLGLSVFSPPPRGFSLPFCPSLLYAPFQGIFLEIFADHTAAAAAPGLAARKLTYEISANSRYLYPLSAMWALAALKVVPSSRSKK